MLRYSGILSGRFPVAAACVALCGLVIGGGASAGVSGMRADATLAITYIGSSSLQVKLPDGTTVRSGTVVPAGSYQILVDDPDFTNPKFTMSGPGVNINSELNSTGMGIDRPAYFGPYTLQTSSTYSVADLNLGGAAITFTTSSTTTASGGSSSGGSSSTSGGSSSTGSGSSSGGTKSGSGSSTSTTMVGTLMASVSASGKPTLAFGGKAVKTLKAGRYTVSIRDHSKKVGLIVWKLGSHAMTLSGAAAIGPKSESVALSAGKWFFEASTRGPRTSFSVTS